ncbi:MAG: dipeptide ABC transporter ATP-binding protein [Chloroflexi bacterium]|jgi:oligopeptide/dipeptide ABC transporter ATP-binding protein|nr:dipeptide ABC transporter ATP-binding protein [Chloroflexota bacterium]
MTTTDAPLLDVRDLVKHYPVRKGLLRREVARVRAVDGVSFHVAPGETFGLVGESGCGKTTAGRAILRLVEPTSGTVTFEGQDVARLGSSALKALRRDMQIVFQDPYGSLDPRMPVGAIIAEGLVVHGIGTASEREARVREAMRQVGLRPEYARRYPHEFSGGQRQRIGIARALVLRPKLVVCDEPVSALDVSIQSQVLNLLKDIQAEMGLTYVFIAHNLAVVKYVASRVGVMYLGKLVETAPSETLYANPQHPYTKALLSAIPQARPPVPGEPRRQRIVLGGDVPSALNPPAGCRFHTRCPVAMDRCRTEAPADREVAPGHAVACHLY